MKKKGKSAFIKAGSPEGQVATEIFRTQYEKSAMNNNAAKNLNEHTGFTKCLVKIIKKFSKETPNYRLAKSILGKDFVSPEKIMKAYKGITYTEEQLVQFSDNIPSREILEWGKDNNCILIAGPNRPMSTIDLHSELSMPCSVSEWVRLRKFSKVDKVQTKWYMIQKDYMLKSCDKNLKEQQALISKAEMIPNCPELIWAVVTYSNMTKDFPFSSRVRTSSVASEDIHVYLRFWHKSGNNKVSEVCFSYGWDSDKDCSLYLVSARELDWK